MEKCGLIIYGNIWFTLFKLKYYLIKIDNIFLNGSHIMDKRLPFISLFKTFEKTSLHIFGTPIELGGMLLETTCKKNTIPSKFVISV